MPTQTCSLAILFGLAASTHAYTTFQPNCTAPSTSVNFVSSNETRGTMDILWSCLFTIIACTWTVQHLNVPEQREDRDKGWRGDIKWVLKRSFRSAKWMLVTAIAPEALITKCLGDLHIAKSDSKRLNEQAAQDEVPWSIAHSLFANMGGFVIRGNVPERIGRLDDNTNKRKVSNEVESPEAVSNGQKADIKLEPVLVDSHTQPPSEDVEVQATIPSTNYPDPYHLTSSDLVTLREKGFLTRLPFITTTELNDKSKSDKLVRVLAVVQILWMIIQVIARAIRHLAVSQLEIGVVAFAICAVVIYIINWGKPKDVQAPYTVLQYRGPIPQEVLEPMVEREGNKGIIGATIQGIQYMLTNGRWGIPWIGGSPVPNHSLIFSLESDMERCLLIQIAGFVLGGIIFGAIHTAAWDFVFPTLIERTLWRVASILCTTIPLVGILLLALLGQLSASIGEFLTLGMYMFLQLLYVVARIFLLVEIFRTLCFLPPTAYVATWAANVPHVA